MVNVEMLVPMSGPKIVRNRGDVVEVSVKEANRLTKAGFAVIHRAEQVDTTTDKTKAEKAVK